MLVKNSYLKNKALVVSFLVVCLLMVGLRVSASGFLNIVNPETVVNTPVLPAPILVPPISEDLYVEGKPSDNHAGAYFKDVSAQKMLFPTSDKSKPDQNQVAFQIISSVIYDIEGENIYLTLSKPSPAARSTEFVLGDKTVELSNGQDAFVNNNLGQKDYNHSVVFTVDGFIVTVLGNAPVEQLEKLAQEVYIVGVD